MSRIGKLPIEVPAGVTITVDSDIVKVSGPKGENLVANNPNLTVELDANQIKVSRKNDDEKTRAAHGLVRTLIKNAILGVTQGFSKELVVEGVGFRVGGGGKSLDMALGYSHPVKYNAPGGIEIKVDKMNITVSGANKQAVGQAAAEIRALRKPEPYKGKGIRYSDEQILRKAGKTGK